MSKLAFLLLFVFCSVQLLAQTNAVFPVSTRWGFKKAGISLNEKYGFLSDTYFHTTEIAISIFEISSGRAIKNVRIESDIELEPFYISNDGKCILLDQKGGVGYNYVYDVELDTLVKNNPQSKYYDMPFGNQDALEVFFPDKYLELDHTNYWFSKQYVIEPLFDELYITDTNTRIRSTYELKGFSGLKDYYSNNLSLSENGSYLAYNAGNSIYVYDLKIDTIVFEGSIEVKRIEGLSIDNKGVLLVAGYFNKEKTLGFHQYNILTKTFINHSTSDDLVNISYVSQFDKYLTLGLGTEKKKNVISCQFIDLTSGMFSSYSSAKGWGSFNDLRMYVEDTLALSEMTKKEHEEIAFESRGYWNYNDLLSDFYDDTGYNPIMENPQIGSSFFSYVDSNFWDIMVINSYQNKVTFQNTSNDFLGIQGSRHFLYFWNGNKRQLTERVVKFFISKNQDPVYFCEDYYYFCPAKLSNAIGFEVDMRYYPLEQFDLKYNRPDIILDRLGYADSALVSAYHQAYQKRLKKMGFTEEMLEDDFHLPEIEIENFEEMPSLHDQGSINLKLKLQDSKYKLDRINVWVNDVAIYGTNGISLRDKNVQEYTTNLEVFLAKGNNKVQVSVLNQAGAESYKETFEVECTVGKTQPDLYLITIGESEFQQADFNLTYAAKDAKDMAALFEKSKVYATVHTKTLVNEQVTKANVKALKSFLQKADINDEVMVFIAGHGVLDANLDYYFATYDMDFQQPQEKGLAYEAVEGLLDGIKPLKKTLLIDACHSGEIDKEEVELAEADVKEEGDIQFRVVGNTATPKLGTQNTSELTKSLFTDLRKGTGATVISSAGGMEFAMEGDDWNNGLFTYCFIKGIQSKAADLNKDGEIWLSEIQQYVSQQVYELSGGRQQPTSRIENQTIDFRVW